ncbi:unnamed protein product, partial [Laminaria digitata]
SPPPLPPPPPILLFFCTAPPPPPVLHQVLEWLITDPDGLYVDCTLGGGGHSAALLGTLSGRGRVVGLDRDPDALREASERLAAEAEAGRFQAIRSNFADVGSAVREGATTAATAPPLPPLLVDGILVDLGVSSHQIDDGARGFSFSVDGPLDMRMEAGGRGGDGLGSSPEGLMGSGLVSKENSKDVWGGEVVGVVSGGGGGGGGDGGGGGGGGDPRSAADVVNFADEMEIRELVWRYGDEKR